MLFKENITLTKMLEFIKQKLNLVIRYKCIIYAINAIINYQISVFYLSENLQVLFGSTKRPSSQYDGAHQTLYPLPNHQVKTVKQIAS